MSGLEPLVNPFTGGLVGMILDVLKKGGGNLANAVNDKRQAAEALKRYSEKFKSRYGKIKILGMSKALELESVFTKVRFLDDLTIMRFATSLEALDDAFRASRSRRLQIRERSTHNAFDVANDNQFLMVLGGPGAGKSTYLRRIALEALKDDHKVYKHDCIPVMLELKHFNTPKVDFTETISKELENFGFPDSREFTERLLELGKLLVLFDGVDEIPNIATNDVITAIQSFTIHYDRNRYIASCRVASHRSTWHHFLDIEIADFDNEQINQFTYNWFSSEFDKQNRTAELCIETLQLPFNLSSLELAQTPLLLTFLCVVYDRTQSFPSNRATLYQKALDIILEEWAAEKRILPGETYPGLNTELEKVLLSEIAYVGFLNDRLFFTETEIITQIKAFLADTVDKPKYLNGKSVLEAISSQQGVLAERAEKIYSFSHFTIQEYLTARYISQDRDIITKTINEHLLSRRWREVFLLISGIVDEASAILEQMLHIAVVRMQSPKVKTLQLWAQRSTASQTDDPKTRNSKRAAALTLALTLLHIRLFTEGDKQIRHISEPLFAARFACYGLTSPLNKQLMIRFYHKDDPRVSDPRPAFDRVYNPHLDIELAHEFQNVPVFSDIDFSGFIWEIKRCLGGSTNDQFTTNTYGLSEYINRLWLSILGLEIKALDFTKDEMEELLDFIYIHELILQCRQTAIRVSQKRWLEIERQLLQIDE